MDNVPLAGPLATLTPTELAASDAAVDAFVAGLGGKDALIAALAVGTDLPEIDRVVTLLLDPRYARYSFRRLCREAGLTVVDLFAAYKSALITRAHLQSYAAIVRELPAVVDDVMKRAHPYPVGCSACGGDGKFRDDKGKPTEAACTDCAGTGTVLQLPDLDRQKLALELGQLVQKSAGITLTQQNLSVTPPAQSGGASFLDVQQAVRDVLKGPRTPLPPIDAEIVPPTPPAPEVD